MICVYDFLPSGRQLVLDFLLYSVTHRRVTTAATLSIVVEPSSEPEAQSLVAD